MATQTWLRALIVITLASSASAPAQAYFRLSVDRAPTAILHVPNKPTATRKAAPGRSAILHGQDVALHEAVAAIVPNGWRSHIAAGIQDDPVSWSAKTWEDALAQIEKANEYRMRVDTARKTVSIDGPRLWVLAPGMMLSQALKGWADLAGWQLVWLSNLDYPIRAQATFRGDFLHAVNSAVQALQENYLVVSPHEGNKVLVVSGGTE